MKKAFFIVAFVATSLMMYAQPRALGGRVGWGIEASYEHSLGTNMVSLDLGVCGFRGVEVAATYDWINPGGYDFSQVWDQRGEWNWYAGVGAGTGVWWRYSNPESRTAGFTGAAGRIGVEYNFWFPMQISIDYRPILGVYYGNKMGFYTEGLYNIALSVRYLLNR